MIYDTAGIYMDTLQSQSGCDSILVLDLQLLETFRDTTVAEICVGDSLEWNGNVYDTAGIYIDSLTSAGGCDSILAHTNHDRQPTKFDHQDK